MASLFSMPEKIYDGATTLVDLIRKQFGDDIEGATQELVRQAGFPEPVARRIATGELPMDPKSVEARRIAQGYGDELYHGSTHDIRAFDGEGNPSNDWGAGTYLTDSTHDVSKNYAGEGPDLTNTLERHVEMNEFQDFVGKDDVRTIGGKDFTESQWEAIGPDKQREYLLIDARNEIKGGNDGVIYPVRVKQDGLLSVHDQVELPDYYQQALDDLDYDYTAKNGTLTEAMEQEIEERMYELEELDTMWTHSPNPNHNMFAVGHETGSDLSGVNRIEEGDTWETVKESVSEGGVPGEDDLGRYYSPGAIAGDTMRRSGAKGVVDPTAPQRFPAMEAGEHTVIFPGSENQIRSVNAAYDPQYTGSNIMGGAAGTAGLAGLLAAGQSEDADASLAKLAARGLKISRSKNEQSLGTEHGFSLAANDAPSHEIARADMWNEVDGDLFAEKMQVKPEHRGSGLMSELYDAIEEMMGKPVTPSTHLTPDGAKFWRKRDPDTLARMLRNGDFDEWDSSGSVREALEGYTGSNIMGGAALPVAAGLLAAGQSEDADAGFITKGGKTLLEAWHGGPSKIDGPFNLSDRDVGIHLADNEELASNAAVKSGFERGVGRDQMQTSPYLIDAGEDQIYDIAASSNRFDAVDIVDELVAAGKIDAERGSQMVDDILNIEESAFNVNQYMRDNLEDASGIRALRYQNTFDAGPTWEDVERGVFESDVRPAPSYMVFNPDYIQKGNATVPMLGATATGTAGLLAAPALMKDGIFQHTASETPIVERKEPVRNQSGLLESVTDFGDEVFKSVRHAAGPVADVLMPYEGVNNYLKTVNDYNKQPTWWDRLGLLDL